MYKSLMVVLVSFTLMLPVQGAELQTTRNSSETFNKNLSMVGAGILGIVLASGALGLINSATLMAEGGGFTEALESGTGLSFPVTLLSAVLGAVFAQDFVARNIHNLNFSLTGDAASH